MKSGRVFILESPNPLDLLEKRGERASLEQVCDLLGHSASAFLLRDAQELRQTFAYIGSIRGNKKDKTPLFLHLSAHGNESGVSIGRDDVSWADLAAGVQEMYSELCYYHGPVVVILSSCGANKQGLTSELAGGLKKAKKAFIPPEYVFVFNQDTVTWGDAVVTWTIFYNQVRNTDFEEKLSVQRLLNNLYKSGYGNLKYFRWDSASSKYKKFEPR
jgi:hypothetical protein